MRPLYSLLFGTLMALAAASQASPGTAPTLASAAQSQIGITLHYDPSYQRLAYPNGDVPLERGICTDVVIRAYRQLGIDLQKLVHEDMRANWNAYPHPAKWGLKRPDTNIDHRRVPNLAAFFRRHGHGNRAKPGPGAVPSRRPGRVGAALWRPAPHRHRGRQHIGSRHAAHDP